MIDELVDYAYRGAFAEVPVESPDVMPLLRRRAAVARSWLLLPVLWKARLGTLSAGWRDELPRPEGPLAWDAAGAVDELRRMPIEPWEPGPVVGDEDPARVWFLEMSAAAAGVCGHAEGAFAYRLVNPRDRVARQPEFDMWRLSRLAGGAVAAAAYESAGGLFTLSDLAGLDGADPDPMTLGPDVRALIYAPRPSYWGVAPVVDR
ncbi:hypothetical protein Mycsm_07026 (plasmid) [Mycobacterium sp. JS623]|uniref:hypothetical protein n=1 Tax=Mycobacterium sp. JS623 TaxID=212767 RepID=UPI0002A5A51E|nr:hypothetical protein [Mycobacterium sp. JS623]AGB27126.1 hypothetical protein Mycsm_07026 [Mycobacterium sp. JS623]